MRYRHTPPVPNPARAPCPRGQARQAGVGIGSGLYRILLLPLLLSAPRADPFVQPAFCLINFYSRLECTRATEAPSCSSTQRVSEVGSGSASGTGYLGTS